MNSLEKKKFQRGIKMRKNRIVAISFQILILLGLIVLVGCETTIKNPNSLPSLIQKQDFTADYQGRATDVVDPGPPQYIFTYDELDMDHAVGVAFIGGVFQQYYAFAFEFLPGTTTRLLGDPVVPDDPRPFHGLPGGTGDSVDWDEIVQGDYHCSPTAAAMVLSYWAKEKGKGTLLQGLPAGATGQVGLIKRLAEYLDTNDQNTVMNVGDNMGHFGTFGIDQTTGISAYASANGGYSFTVTPRAFNFASYKNNINNNRPVIITFRNPGTKMGHVVVGYGYDGNNILYKDPADGSSNTVPSHRVRSASDVNGALSRSYGQLIPLPIEPSKASGEWIDAMEITIDEAVSP